MTRFGLKSFCTLLATLRPPSTINAPTMEQRQPTMAGKKFYAIAAGHRPGIYNNWPEAQAQVHGFPGAVYKGFPSLAEAEAWLRSPSYRPGAGRPTGSPRPAPAPRASAPPAGTAPKAGEVTIYTDGGAIYNPGPGGYGVVQIYEGVEQERSGGFRLTTNNRMELMGTIVALRELEYRDKPVTLYSDSSYVVNGINKGWAQGWRKRGWIKSDRQPAVNPDLWAELLDLLSDLQVTFKWVKGHSGNPFNERCDQLAVANARRENLPADPGYKDEK